MQVRSLFLTCAIHVSMHELRVTCIRGSAAIWHQNSFYPSACQHSACLMTLQGIADGKEVPQTKMRCLNCCTLTQASSNHMQQEGQQPLTVGLAVLLQMYSICTGPLVFLLHASTIKGGLLRSCRDCQQLHGACLQSWFMCQQLNRACF